PGPGGDPRRCWSGRCGTGRRVVAGLPASGAAVGRVTPGHRWVAAAAVATAERSAARPTAAGTPPAGSARMAAAAAVAAGPAAATTPAPAALAVGPPAGVVRQPGPTALITQRWFAQRWFAQVWGTPPMATAPGRPAGTSSSITAIGPVAWTSTGSLPAFAMTTVSMTVKTFGGTRSTGAPASRWGPSGVSRWIVTVTVRCPVFCRLRASAPTPVIGGVVATSGLGTTQRLATVVVGPATADTVPHCGTAPAAEDCTVRSTTTPGPPDAVTVVAYVMLAGIRVTPLVLMV